MVRKLKYGFYTTNEIKPSGWLRRQLEIQANGLSGNLDKIWPDVRDSAWIGGDREGWERVPYWLDGFIPLAYLLEDEDMIARAKRYMDAIMDAQCADGWICPCKEEDRANYDTWATLLMAKVLTVWADCSGDERAVDALRRCLAHFNAHINVNSLRNWGAARWFEGALAALWLYDRTGEEWLIDLCKKLEFEGFDWKKVLSSRVWEKQTVGWDLITHVVNVAMMLKSDALMSRIDGGDADEFASAALDYLLKNHGMAIPHFTGDECLSGTSSIHGSELCSVVEAMFSYEQIFSVSGNTAWMDQLERLAFNALPATISSDMWVHQYTQMSNQVECTVFDDEHNVFRCNYNDAHTFGLEPNFGCCTANFNQGWPKLALSTFMKTEKGIASCALLPTVLNTKINGVGVRAELVSEYPFRNKLTYKIHVDSAVYFEFAARIPSFAKSATVNGASVPVGEMYRVAKRWEGDEKVEIELDFETKYVVRPNNLRTIWRGPLLYSLPIGENWVRREYVKDGVERKFPYCDYDITPTTDWNYAFDGEADEFRVFESDFDVPFSTEKPPVYMVAPMAQIEWKYANGVCAKLPESAEPIGKTVEKVLIPYGCTNLRITETYRAKR